MRSLWMVLYIVRLVAFGIVTSMFYLLPWGYVFPLLFALFVVPAIFPKPKEISTETTTIDSRSSAP